MIDLLREAAPEADIYVQTMTPVAADYSLSLIHIFSAYIGSYLGEWTSTGNYMPLFVAAVSAAAMGLFEYLARKRGMTWLDNFSMAGSMLVGMAAAVALFAVV